METFKDILLENLKDKTPILCASIDILESGKGIYTINLKKNYTLDDLNKFLNKLHIQPDENTYCDIHCTSVVWLSDGSWLEYSEHIIGWDHYKTPDIPKELL